MKIKKIVPIFEEEKEPAEGIKFLASTRDVFPYIESAINTLDTNFNWWKRNWEELERKLVTNIIKITDGKSVKIIPRFMIYNGPDEKTPDIIWHGPAIQYIFDKLSSNKVKELQNLLGGNTWKGHKLIVQDDTLIVLFG